MLRWLGVLVWRWRLAIAGGLVVWTLLIALTLATG